MRADDSTCTADGVDRAFAPPTLTIYDLQSRRCVALTPGAALTIGRSRGCDIRVDDPTVSARHLRIEYAPRLQAIDLGSSLGTRHDGLAMQPHTPIDLRDNSRLQLGRDCRIHVDDERSRWESRLEAMLPSDDAEPDLSADSDRADTASALKRLESAAPNKGDTHTAAAIMPATPQAPSQPSPSEFPTPAPGWVSANPPSRDKRALEFPSSAPIREADDPARHHAAAESPPQPAKTSRRPTSQAALITGIIAVALVLCGVSCLMSSAPP